MNSLTSPKNPSPFAQSALALDSDFTELERLAGEIDRLEIESDSGFERAKKLLAYFGEHGERIGSGVQSLAKELDAARTRAEKAAALVTEKAMQIQQRQVTENEMNQRFVALAEKVKKVTESMAQLQKPAGVQLSEEEKALLLRLLPEMDERLSLLVVEARALKMDASAASLKTLMKNADAMAQSLEAARLKLSVFIDAPAAETLT